MRLGFMGSILALAVVLHAGPARAVAPAPRAERTRPADGPRIASVTPPLVFEENRGQAGAAAAFVVRHSTFTAFIEPHAATFAAGGAEPVRMAFREPAPGRRVEGRGPTGGVTTSFRAGRDAIRARHFATATTPALRPGIDLRWRSDEHGRLTYDLVVAPGADPAGIAFDVTGARGVRVAADGSLRIETAAGEMTQSRPVVYQETECGRVRVAGEFALRGESVVGFDVGAYDRTRTLVIDPEIEYAARLDGGSYGRAVALDSKGAVYLAGMTHSSAFPTSTGLVDAQGDDVFVTKLAPGARSVVWAVVLGGADRDEAVGVAVNAQGEAVVGGTTRSTDFPLAGSLIQRERDGNFGFVSKLSADGASVLFSTLVGLPDRQSDISGLALDTSGRAVVAGVIWDGAAFVTEGAYRSPDIGGNDAFVAKLAADGSALVWGALLGGDGQDSPSAVALGADGAVYLCGNSELGTFPVTADLFPGEGNGDEMFLAKLSEDGASLAYSVEFATGSDDRAFAVAVDAAGGAYLTGDSNASREARRARSFLPVTRRPVGSPKTGPRGSPFVLKVNPAGDALEWSVRVGGPFGVGYALAADDSGGVVVAGAVGRTGPAPAVHRYGRGGDVDCFVARLSRDAKSVTYTAILGGDEHDEGRGIALDRYGGTYVVGTTHLGEPPFDRMLLGTESPDGATVARFAQQTVRLVMRSGAVSDGPGFGDSFTVAGGHGFANGVEDFDPRNGGISIHFRIGDDVVTKLISTSRTGWVRSANGVYFYDGRADHSLKVWLTAKTFRIVVTQIDIDTPMENPVSLQLQIGDDYGYDQRTWRRTSSGSPARLQLGN